MRYGLYVDDVRDVPYDLERECDHWAIAYDYFEAIKMLQRLKWDVLSLDHDLACCDGSREYTGYDICLWLAEQREQGLVIPPDIRVHSKNPVGRERMLGVIERYLK